jgi:hypothetical protein
VRRRAPTVKPNKSTKLIVALAATAVLASACASNRGDDPYAVGVGGSGVSADLASSTSDAKFGTLDSP